LPRIPVKIQKTSQTAFNGAIRRSGLAENGFPSLLDGGSQVRKILFGWASNRVRRPVDFLATGGPLRCHEFPKFRSVKDQPNLVDLSARSGEEFGGSNHSGRRHGIAVIQ